MNSILTASDLQRLERETFVERVEGHETIGSTNDRAGELGRSAEVLTPLLVITETQTAGRGRGAHRWWSRSGALTFSLLLEPARWGITPPRWPAIALAAGVTLCRLLERRLPAEPARLKWPNDVYLRGRKLCGILAEPVVTEGAAPTRLVLGVGINVNNSCREGAPAELQQTALALCDVTHAAWDRVDLLIDWLHECQRSLQQLGQDDEALSADWQRLDLLRGEQVTIDQPTGSVSGHCEGIARDGGLMLLTGDGPTTIYGGTVRQRGSSAIG